jgi:hypothetical protein
LILRRSPPLHVLLIVWNVSMWNWSKTNAVLYKIMKLQEKFFSFRFVFRTCVESISLQSAWSVNKLTFFTLCLHCCNCDGNMSALFPHPNSL